MLHRLILFLLLVAPAVAESLEQEKPGDLLAAGLDGWTYPDEKQADAWSLDSGVLRSVGKPSGYIRTREKYGDFMLRLDIRHPEKAGNSGVLLRVTGEDKVWPRSIEAQGQKGNLGDIHLLGGFAAEHEGKRKTGGRLPRLDGVEEAPVGEWNSYEIRMRGGDIELYVNGELANKVTYADAEPGYIALQSEGVPVDFRNVQVTRTATEVAAPGDRDSKESGAAASAAVPREPRDLFNGQDLTGWSGRGDLWRVEDGTIIGETTKDKRTNGNTFLIYTGTGTLENPQTFDDFELTFDFRLSPDTNNNAGIQYRSQHRGDYVVQGYQFDIQRGPQHMGKLYDEKGRKRVAMAGERVEYRDTKKVLGQTVPPQELAAAEREGWNTATVVARGNRIIHRVNGVEVIDFTDLDEKNAEASGVIALQLHAGEPMRIEFRSIKLTTWKSGKE